VSEVNVHEAKTHFSKLLRRVENGEEVVIARGGKPIARLVPYQTVQQRQFGFDKGRFRVPTDFDAPLPEGVLDLFE
jgi:prevent-host-death family protein